MSGAKNFKIPTYNIMQVVESKKSRKINYRLNVVDKKSFLKNM